MSTTADKNNISKFNNKDTVEFYNSYKGLQDCESYIVNKYFTKNPLSVLDIGIGVGRTTSVIKNLCSIYIGIDYAQNMILEAKQNFPDLDLRVMNANDLSFKDQSFDILLFSFNGIDYFPDDLSRSLFFKEAKRVLKKDGLLIFSSHNLKCLFSPPTLRKVSIFKKMWRILRSLLECFKRIYMLIRAKLLFSDSGYMVDSTHGGLMTHMSSTNSISVELEVNRFKLIEVVPFDIRFKSTIFSPWIYYVAKKK